MKEQGLDIYPYIKASYPVLWIVTHEENRGLNTILQTVQKLNNSNGNTWTPIFWSHTKGFVSVDIKNGDPVETQLETLDDPIAALNHVMNKARDDVIQNQQKGKKVPNEIYVFRDLHPFMNAPKVVRYIRDMADFFKQTSKRMIILSPSNKVPLELEHDVTVLDYKLPTKEEITMVWDSLANDLADKLGTISDDERDRIVQAAMGLTIMEAENAFSKSIVMYLSTDKKDRDVTQLANSVMHEKALSVKKSGILEYFDTTQTVDDIGGLKVLKKWFEMRRHAFTTKAREYGLPHPRGILLVGLPGCGKSLTAKAASSALGVPLLKFDVGRVFGGLVGESESNMRLVIQTAEAVGSCVLYIDEMEKAFAGVTGSSGDSGTSQRVFGSFLTWMQEKTAPCFIIATVNRIDGLPPELLRKGRFDEIFYVGLPDPIERREIFKIHLSRYGRDPSKITKQQYSELVAESDQFSGAEIEESVISGLYTAFSEDREIGYDDIINAIENTNPLAVSRAEQLEQMKKWAEDNAVNASEVKNSKTPVGVRRRKIDAD